MRASALPIAALVFVVCAEARADGVASCDDAFERSQVVRDEGKLLEARRLFRACGAPTCSPTEHKLCSKWLGEVEVRVPSVILSAKDATGADLTDLTVTMDGLQIAKGLDGRALDVDPGAHVFVFIAPDGARAETKVVVEERGKGKVVAVRFAPPAAAAVLPIAPVPTTPVDGGSSLRTVGLVTGAVGIGGLALGTVFGILALTNKSSDCHEGVCTPGSSATVYGQGNVSTAGFVAGGVLLAGGVTLVLLAPKPAGGGGASVTLTPLVGGAVTGLDVAGRW